MVCYQASDELTKYSPNSNSHKAGQKEGVGNPTEHGPKMIGGVNHMNKGA